MTHADNRVCVHVALLADADERAPAGFTPDEHARRERISAPLRRRQFVAGHVLARRLASQFAGGDTDDWVLSSDTNGAPRLHTRDGAATLHVSLAHSGERVACAVARVPIGIDLEAAPRDRDFLALAAFVFAPETIAALQAVDGEARKALFHRTWALAEAHGKRSGEGLRWQQSRQRVFRECAPAEATHRTWQDAAMTLALAGPRGLAVEIAGWDAPEPRYWTAESTATGTAPA